MTEKNNKGYVHLDVRPETKKLVLEDCKATLLKEHPELEGLNITQDFLVNRIAKYYRDN